MRSFILSVTIHIFFFCLIFSVKNFRKENSLENDPIPTVVDITSLKFYKSDKVSSKQSSIKFETSKDNKYSKVRPKDLLDETHGKSMKKISLSHFNTKFYTPAPNFPKIALDENVKNIHILAKIQTNEDGHASSIQLVNASMIQEFDEEVLKTLQNWVMGPNTEYYVPFNFIP